MKKYEQKKKSEIVVNEELAYKTMLGSEETVLDDVLDIDNYYERYKKAIETTYERIQKNKTRAPEGYYTLEEFDELFKKKLSEAYATV